MSAGTFIYNFDFYIELISNCVVFLNQGCLSLVADLADCSMPCSSSCETCYPNTGFCTKCKPGIEGLACDAGQCF